MLYQSKWIDNFRKMLLIFDQQIRNGRNTFCRPSPVVRNFFFFKISGEYKLCTIRLKSNKFFSTILGTNNELLGKEGANTDLTQENGFWWFEDHERQVPTCSLKCKILNFADFNYSSLWRIWNSNSAEHFNKFYHVNAVSLPFSDVTFNDIKSNEIFIR